ncbi:MAG: alpha-xylosidase [Flexilinea sp.]|nr:alpha-xylosidase [Flexilinea sp.]
MKFTEGYWLRSERSNPIYAAQAYLAEEIPGGMRILAPANKITGRAATIDQPALTVEFTAAGANVIKVRVRHFQGDDSHEPRFEVTESPADYTVSISEKEAVLTVDDVCLRVKMHDDWLVTFEANGKVITSCGFRNLGYMRWDKKPSTMFCDEDYLSANYKPYMVSELSLNPGECVYGFGERFTSFVKNGQVVQTWNEDGGTASQVAYKCIPFYMTNRGYGVFVDQTGPVEFETASEKVEYVGFSVPGEELRYYFIYGPEPKKVLQRYTDMTGKPALPPAWSFGLWLTTSFTTSYDENTILSFINGMADRNIPLHVFHFDCFWMREFHLTDFVWDKAVISDPEKIIRECHDRGLHTCAWFNPYVAQGSEFFEEGLKNGYFLQRADGKGIKQVDIWQPGLAIVDFTNPDAKKWYQEKLRGLLAAGIDCFKTDFAERIPIDVKYYDGSDPLLMHNYYTYLYNRACFEVLEEVRGKGEAMLFARSATAGGQKFPAHWGGDCSASYNSMAETLRGGLSLMLSGFSFWSHDISGFEETATPDVYKRWCAFGLLSTHSRLHGSKSYRVPWLFDEEACDVLRFFTEWKSRLMPYLYAEAVNAHETGIPEMRPMILEFPHDPAVNYLDMQYMLGGKLLIAPVFNEEGHVDYYLPDGTWTHLYSEEKRSGGRWYGETYDYFSLPIYVRENSILPLGGCKSRPDYDYLDGLELHLYEPKNGGADQIVVPDVKGNPVLEVSFRCEKDEVTLNLDKAVPGLKVIVHEAEIREYPLNGTEIHIQL